jgi:Eukaryotic aspartyl protease
VNQDGGPAYANLPKAMANAGLINSTAYSLWLNDLEANTGSILFGGVDTEKYHGQLETLPILPIDGEYIQFVIALTKLVLSSGSTNKAYTSSSLPTAVLLDSGSSLTYLPDALVQDIYNDFQVTYDSSSGIGYVPCSTANQNVKLVFTFSSPSIPVSIGELVLNTGSGLTFDDGTPACTFGISPAGGSTAVLGDTFLRSAYVVYDLANNEIALAETNFNSTESNVMEIGSGTAAIPDATAVSNPVTTVVVNPGGARIGAPSGTGVIIPGISASSTAAAGTRTSLPKHLAAGIAGMGLFLAI